MYQEVTGEDFVPSALSNIGMKLLIKGWREGEPQRDPIELVGKEKVAEVVWDEKSRGFENGTTSHPWKRSVGSLISYRVLSRRAQ